MTSTTTQQAAAVLALDPIRCDGRGLCHDAAPHLIELDEWGYPVLPGGTVRANIAKSDLAAARDATHACPVLALHLEKPPPPR
ncbi:MAG: ferredoxin [Actinomycetales bacterium]|nr:ferredoxin [Actinomycetales bacterium]